jgi:hypothetical protein
MFTKSGLLVILILFCLRSINFNNSVYSQATAKIDFTGSEKQMKETKSLLSKYEIYIVLSANDEIKANFTKDSLLVIENITQSQMDKMKDQEFLLVKFLRKTFCYYSLLPNGFFVYNTISCFMIYETTKKHKFIKSKHKRWATNFCYKSKEGWFVGIPLSIIPCSEYKGEYDNGIEAYLESTKR